MTRARAYAILIAACALPRVLVLLHERAALLSDMEKSDLLAQMFLRNGTFGYVPGEPSASTQPLYGWFLIVVYWIFGRHWWSFSSVQIAVAVGTTLIVFEIGRRFLSTRAGLIAALISTLQPYLIWHDVHGNREILDQPLGAAMFGLALLCAVRPSLKLAAALGLISGVAILSNTRLVALPIALALYLLWRHAGWAAAIAVPVLAVVAMSPWVIRNKVEVGCFAITTDARALWKANNLGTYATLAGGQWIDEVPDIPQRRLRPVPFKWFTPQEAGNYYADHGVKIPDNECFQQAHYEHLVEQFWKHHPGAKAKLMVQATGMLWSPRVGLEGSPNSGLDQLRSYVEPIYVIPLYILAVVGLFVVPLYFRVLALIFIGYETLAAWVFAGTTRYRVAWDFVLALLAAAAIEWLIARYRAGSSVPFRRPSSQNR
jgi:4-amino-4-deoxy-L-arabinose transferase-like glycosyltransferase